MFTLISIVVKERKRARVYEGSLLLHRIDDIDDYTQREFIVYRYVYTGYVHNVYSF